MADFSQYGGPSEEWLALEKTLPAVAFDLSLDPAKLQKGSNDMREEASRKAMEVLGPKVRTQDHTIPTRDGSSVEARSYRPASADPNAQLPVYLYFHGGGFVFGSLSSEDAACALIASEIGIAVLNVNYRHTPQHPFPTAWLDAQDSFAWLHDNIKTVGGDPQKVVVGGISAGGQLTASLVLEKHLGKALEKYPPIAGQVLMIPALAHLDTYKDGPGKRLKDPSISSYVENKDAPILPEKTIQWFVGLLKTGTPSFKDTKLNIINATVDEVKGFPPTVFGICGLDPLRDEGLLYAQTLVDAGVPTNVTLFKGVPHGFTRFGPALSAVAKWNEVVQKGILWTLENPKAGPFNVKVP